ncbi:MAG: hypothetical protein FWD40_09795 [Treponema sp.]|nr:hypothetical protein [Treponema sp.]
MKRFLKSFIAVFAVISLMTVFFISCDDPDDNGVPYDYEYNYAADFVDGSLFQIRSPYAGVNWNTYNQYRTTLHSHTTNSDGSASMEEYVDRHYELDYDIVALTDHVWKGSEGTRRYLDLVNKSWTQASWTTANNNFNTELTSDLTFISQDKLNAVQAGTGRDGKPMLMIPNTAEFAFADAEEMNVFFFEGNAPPAWTRTIRQGMQYTVNTSPRSIFFINHPGRTTNSMNFLSGVGSPANAANPANPSNQTSWIRRFANLYMEFPRTALVGMEVFNREDQDSLHDRVLWDNILTLTIPEGRFVWGYANDDSHSVSGVGINYQMMIMPSNSTSNFRSAMINGHSYMVTCMAKNEGVNRPRDSIDRPIVNSVVVNHAADTITITATNATSIVWISEGKIIHEETGTASTLNMADAAIIDQVGGYVRANIIGPNGMAAIQPIATKRTDVPFEGGEGPPPVIKTVSLTDNFQYGEGYQGLIDGIFAEANNLTGTIPGKVEAGDVFTLTITFTVSRPLEDNLQIGIVDRDESVGWWNPLTWDENIGDGLPGGIYEIPVAEINAGEVTREITLTAAIAASGTQAIRNSLVFQTEGAGTPGTGGSGVEGVAHLRFTEFSFVKEE